MLYEENSLTVEQAEQIIGEKMIKRIELLNDWVMINGYVILMHSTFKGIEKDIFLDNTLEKLIKYHSEMNLMNFEKIYYKIYI